MKTLYFNGNFYLGNGEFTHSLLEENGIIIEMGDSAALEASGANAVDLEGKTVVPGFNDSHMHLYGVGTNQISVQLYGSESISDMQGRIEGFIKKNNLPKGEFLTGRGWNQDYFPDGKLPSKQDLDKVAPGHVLILRRACGHVCLCNSKALQLAGISKGTKAPEGGAIDFDESGEPTGILREHAMGMAEGLIPKATMEKMMDTIDAAMTYAVSQGITSVQTNDINGGNYDLMHKAYRQVADSGRAKVRVNMQSCFNDVETFKEFLSKGYTMNMGDSLYKLGPLKLFVDGSLGARTALMRKPYEDDQSTMGITCLTQEQLDEFVKVASLHKMQVITHAIGDKAIEMTLDAIENHGGENNPLRHGVVHAQITDKALVERFKKLNALALVQPIFLHYDMHVVESRVGIDLAHSSYAFGTMDKIGIHTSFGTDSPVEDLKTFDNLHCAVNRQDLKMYPQDGYVSSEGFTLENAIKCYTEEGAYASFEEGKKGKLTVGQVADFAVLDSNIFDTPTSNLIKTKVLMTVMGGKVVYTSK